jgi:hypothetical protein
MWPPATATIRWAISISFDVIGIDGEKFGKGDGFVNRGQRRSSVLRWVVHFKGLLLAIGQGTVHADARTLGDRRVSGSHHRLSRFDRGWRYFAGHCCPAPPCSSARTQQIAYSARDGPSAVTNAAKSA